MQLSMIFHRVGAFMAAAFLVVVLALAGCSSKPKLPVGTWVSDFPVDRLTVTITKDRVLITEAYLKPTGARVVNRFKITSWYKSEDGLVIYTENGLQYIYDREDDTLTAGRTYKRAE